MTQEKTLNATHGSVYCVPSDSFFPYFGWPSLARTADGALCVAVSGFRHGHICPWGKTVLFSSRDEGETWSGPVIVNDSMIDDRDAGLTTFPDGGLLLSWFTSDTRHLLPDPPEFMRGMLSSWSDEAVRQELGSFVRSRNQSGEWGAKVPVEVTSPHGPILLRNGNLFYFGSRFGERTPSGEIRFDMTLHYQRGLGCAVSGDRGRTWEYRGGISKPQEFEFLVEPHAVELNDGRILGMVRVEKNQDTHFEIWKTYTRDEGRTWSPLEFVCEGSPPHLMRLPGGILLCSYACRRKPYGIRVMFSRDEGASWDTNWTVRGDFDDDDLGYTSSVLLSNGSVLSVYYSQGKLGWSRWEIPPEFHSHPAK